MSLALKIWAPRQQKSGFAPRHLLVYTPAKENEFELREKTRRGGWGGVSSDTRGWGVNGGSGILFAMAPFHPPWGCLTVWMSWFVLRVTKHGTPMFICIMTKLERHLVTRWTVNYSRVSPSVRSPAEHTALAQLPIWPCWRSNVFQYTMYLCQPLQDQKVESCCG